MNTELPKKPMTLDDLALMVANGFANTATKQDLENLATKQDLKITEESLKKDLNAINDRLKIVETKLDKALYTDMVKLETRVKRIEEHIGLKPSSNLDIDFSR